MTTESIVLNKNKLVIELKFDRNYFDTHIKSPSNFYKILSNSKSSLPNGRTNRNWWKSIKPSGFYKYKSDSDFTEIILILTSERQINELELKCRIKKIGTPIHFNVTYDNTDLFTILSDKNKNREGIEKFGWTNSQPLFIDIPENNILQQV